jgi:hypothetical protein
MHKNLEYCLNSEERCNIVLKGSCPGRQTLPSAIMTTSKSTKVTLTKPKCTKRPTPPSISQSQKKAAYRSPASTMSTSALSKHTSVEDVNDDELTSIGPTLDADGDSIMELSDGEGRRT